MNHLANETSPYLLQHRHNPVDWYPWGLVALKRSKDEDKPIFLSIGYAACHWCHVMEHESFEDESIAKLLNERFVCIKVDREERPDLDEIYMAAVQGMTGHGGWPMSVWLTPDRAPFYAGTYFPPEDRQGMPGFRRVLEHVDALWRDRRDLVVDQAQKVAGYLDRQLAPELVAGEPEPAMLDRFVEQSAQHFDPDHKGFGGGDGHAPKFPHAAQTLLLLRRGARGDARARAMALETLGAMADGGIHDQLGGGFHRYAVDRAWLVPHFEKMLYDNALLADCYLEAFALTGDERWAEVARRTLDWIVGEMQEERGGFWSSTDADSEGHEGKYFVWRKEELDALLGDDAKVVASRFGVSSAGNWEGHSVLFAAKPVGAVAKELGLEATTVAATLERARTTLLAARRARVAPATDDKVLAAWNGMAIGALASGHQLLGEQRWLVAAQRAAGFVLGSMRDERGRLLRSWRAGRAVLPGYLEDHAIVAESLLRLFQSDFDPRWLIASKDLLARVDEHFGDPETKTWFAVADDHEELLTRAQSVQESSTPSGIAMAVLAHQTAALLLGDPAYRERALAALRAHHRLLAEFPVACSGLVLGVDHALGDPREIVIAQGDDAAGAAALLAIARHAVPRHHAIVLVTPANSATLESATPIVAGKTPRNGKAAAYVCRLGVCDAPISSPDALRAALAPGSR
ncbi:MAG: thioredoxin domain-containing protein [Planctomycetes bacterium]|nr:thioredoxin domain-containing protein [Planctomycetota bacterium]